MTCRELTHLDLFAGIGGFALAARLCGGIRTVAFAEVDPYCCAVLAERWPDVPNVGDITKLCRRVHDCEKENEAGEVWCPRCQENFSDCDCIGTDQFIDTFGSVDIITGGFPCQPYSTAGKRKGKSDHRSLWPQMCRVIDQIRPAWIIGENAAGIVSLELDEVLSDLERIGYASRTFVIPACAVAAGHRRTRAWIIAHSDSGRREQQRQQEHTAKQSERRPESDRCHSQRPGNRPEGFCTWPDEAAWSAESGMDRISNGIPHRIHRVRALGNSLVPQVAQEIFQSIIAVETQTN